MKKKVKIKIEHKIGDERIIEGEDCIVRFVNQGTAWFFPLKDCPENTANRCIAFARVDEEGEVTII